MRLEPGVASVLMLYPMFLLVRTFNVLAGDIGFWGKKIKSAGG